MRIAISVGHAAKVRGASGPEPWGLDEVDEAYKVVGEVANKLQSAGVQVETYFDTVSTSQSENLNRLVNWHNESAFGGSSHDLDVSIHFNAYQVTSKPMGCECLYVTQQTLSAEVAAALAMSMDLPNRGAKYRSDLAFLNGTHAPAVLVETCFVDSSTDAEHYRVNYDRATTALAEALGGVDIGAQPPDTELPPDGQPPETVTGANRVEIVGKIIGDVTLYINDVLIKGHENCEHTVDLNIQIVGDTVLVVNGEEFHNPTPPPVEPEYGIQANHCSIVATVFGGSDDPNNSAYPPYALLDGDNDDFVALPYSFDSNLFPDSAPQVRVYRGELSAVGKVADKGPWTTDDSSYVIGTARPIAETCYHEGAPLPSGPNAGRVPSNPAGIDLSPALARKIGIEGKGTVDWEFVD